MTATATRDERTMAFAAMLCLYRNNAAAEVAEALHAAFENQTVRPSQLIAVFDGPVPADVTAVIDRFARTHDVRRIIHQECRGHGAARAAAINACAYDWLAIIDADDVSMPRRFADLCQAITRRPNAAVIGGGLIEFHVKDNEKVFGHIVNYPESPAAVRHYLRARSPVAQPTSILRVAAIKEVGNYQDWFNNEDYHLWIRLIAAGYELYNVPRPILWFRTNPDLFARRGGLKYWWNEVRLQIFSYRCGTTTMGRLLTGSLIRFMVQVVMSSRARKVFYERILRKL